MNENLKNEIYRFYDSLDMDLPDETNKIAIDLIPKLVKEIFGLERSIKVIAKYYQDHYSC